MVKSISYKALHRSKYIPRHFLLKIYVVFDVLPAEVMKNTVFSLLPASAGFLHSLVIYPEDGNDLFLRNIGLSRIYMMLQPRKRHSSQSLSVRDQLPNPHVNI
jgi:hypothetical protein